MNQLLRGELLKIRTVRSHWLFSIGVVVSTSLALVLSCWLAKSMYGAPAPSGDVPPEVAEQLAAATAPVTLATDIATSGQYFGLLFALLAGILVITNEYHYRTATLTFLAVPRRTVVVIAKLLVAMFVAASFWLFSTVLSVGTGIVFLDLAGIPNHLGDSEVVRAILLNLLAYLLWAVFGVGVGALFRSQVGAVVTVTVLYLIGFTVLGTIIQGIYVATGQAWVLKVAILVPSIASSSMLSPVQLFADSPPQWTGAVVLVGYGIVLGGLGALILRRRDIA